jgi:hypothetical protein
MKEVPDAASYAPVTVLIDERADGVCLPYDLMTSSLGPYENAPPPPSRGSSMKRFSAC